MNVETGFYKWTEPETTPPLFITLFGEFYYFVRRASNDEYLYERKPECPNQYLNTMS